MPHDNRTKRYFPIQEKPYCCVPAVLQMIQKRYGLPTLSQDEIGWQLGLMVPEAVKSHFTRVRIGPKPTFGYGTQTYLRKFSIRQYFLKNKLPLRLVKKSLSNAARFSKSIEEGIRADRDVVVCYNSSLLFGVGDYIHLSLIESIDVSSNLVILVNPAIGAPKWREVSVKELYKAIQSCDQGELWIISKTNALVQPAVTRDGE